MARLRGVAVAEALRGVGFDEVRLKWPNDVVVVGHEGLRKLGGLLIEGSGEHAGPTRAVIGLGLNVHMPAEAARGIHPERVHGIQVDTASPMRWLSSHTPSPWALSSRSVRSSSRTSSSVGSHA